MRVPGGQRNFLTFVLVAAAAFVVTLYVTPSEGEVGQEDLVVTPSSEALPGSETPAAVPGVGDGQSTDVPSSAQPVPESAGPGSAGLRAYALPLVELQGLPPDVSPGTQVELWVAWDPPVTEKARVQKLFGGAQVGRVIPPTVAEAPTTVELLVPVTEFPELLFADRHGALSAAVLP